MYCIETIQMYVKCIETLKQHRYKNLYVSSQPNK